MITNIANRSYAAHKEERVTKQGKNAGKTSNYL